jgi:hypothetical protein
MGSLVAFVDFAVDLVRPEVAAVLSRELFGATSFVGEGTGLRDEVPALALQRDFLGMIVVLHGYGGEDGYSLEMETRPSWLARIDPNDSGADALDISTLCRTIDRGSGRIQGTGSRSDPPFAALRACLIE